MSETRNLGPRLVGRTIVGADIEVDGEGTAFFATLSLDSGERLNFEVDTAWDQGLMYVDLERTGDEGGSK